MQNKTLKRKLNLVPQNLLIYEMLKIVQWVVIGLCIAGVILMTVIAVKGYMEIDRLDKELAEDKQIIAEGHLDELNALKEQYDNLILGIDSGNITLIPDIDIKMTELFTVITQHKPSAAQLTGVEGQLKSTGEYTYRMGYCITLEDGSFVLIDSGSPTRKNASANKDHIRIWNLLNKLNKREDGQIIIRAWIITHNHDDHNGVFKEFTKTYGKKVTIENQYECVLPESIYYNSKNPGSTHGTPTSIHAGMKLNMYGVEIEFLTTPEDIYPRTLRYFNNASTTFTISANGTKFIVLGDSCDQMSDIIAKRYGSYLKSDIVQVAHHGNIGATSELYDFIDPTVALWPTSANLFADLIDGVGNQRHFGVNYHLYKELHVKENYTNGEYTVSLTLGEGGYQLGSAERFVVSTNDQYKDK